MSGKLKKVVGFLLTFLLKTCCNSAYYTSIDLSGWTVLTNGGMPCMHWSEYTLMDFVRSHTFSYKMLTQKTFLASWLPYPEGQRFSLWGNGIVR